MIVASSCTNCLLGKHERCTRGSCDCCGGWNGNTRNERINQAVTAVLEAAQPGQTSVIDDLVRQLAEIDGWSGESVNELLGT